MSYDDPLSEDMRNTKFAIFRKPKTRREWAEGIYNTIFVIEGSTMAWDVRSSDIYNDRNIAKIIQEAVRYFTYYKMMALAWWTGRLAKQIISGEYIPHDKDSIRLTVNNLRGIMHDEWMKPEDPNIKDEFSIRSDIRKEYVDLRDI